MRWNKHSQLADDHSFLSPSNYHWLNYSEEHLIERYDKWYSVRQGTLLHDFAARAIKLKIKLPSLPVTLNMYINDAINMKMTTEQALYYSNNCFGHADAIRFDDNDRILQISDLKTGKTKPSFKQLRIYAALFCLEYGWDPYELETIELRLYYDNQCLLECPDADTIQECMNTIVNSSALLDKHRKEMDMA